MPVVPPPDSPCNHHLYRRIRCVRGAVRIALICRPACDYGRKVHQILLEPNGVLFKSNGLSLTLSAAWPSRRGTKGACTPRSCLREGGQEGSSFKVHLAVTFPPSPPIQN